jgi:hypothetical protein
MLRRFRAMQDSVQDALRGQRCVESGAIKPMPRERIHLDPQNSSQVKSSGMVG